MQAAVRSHYGGPEVFSIEEVETPQPKPNEVQVKIYAATVNRTDCGALWGKPWIVRLFTGFPKPKLKSTGVDFAGEVTRVGSKVSDLEVGDRVFGFNDNGLASHAQYLCIPSKKAIHMPDNITYAQGAASLEGAHYAYNFINKVKFKKGDRFLVNGGTGAIGSALVQLLTTFGADVTAVCRGEHADLVKDLGAQRIIDYSRVDFTQDEETYQCVFDAVGKSTFGECKRLLEWNGVYISSELGPKMQNPFLALITPLGGGKRVKFPLPRNSHRSVLLMKELIEKGKFKPLLDRSYPLEEIAQAYTYVAQGKKVGNVILQPFGE